MSKTKHCKTGVVAVLASFVLFACGPAEVVNEESRINALMAMDNYTWHYYTEVDGEVGDDYKLVRAYDGEGRITKTNAMTIETVSTIETYSLEYVYSLKEDYPNYSLEEYISEYLVPYQGTYEIDYQNNTVTVKAESGTVSKCFIILDDAKNQYEYSAYLFRPDETIRVVREPRYLSEDELSVTIKNYIPANQSFFESVVNENNKVDKDSYSLSNPESAFHFADSGVMMSAHQINSIKLSFNKNSLSNIDYVNGGGREVNVSISKVGSTKVELPPEI